MSPTSFHYEKLVTELEGTLEGLSLDEGADEERGVEVGKPVTFSVDAAGAGEGTLELVVSTPTTTVKAEVRYSSIRLGISTLN